ncbi:mitoguardin-like [Lycorma delicatula]|uniref:mitoguardin-like n=1 Tax=Lycorma delicatula TaxID=130591 RepID=UPI003F511B4D
MSSSKQIVIAPLLKTFRSIRDIALFRGLSISKSQKVVLISVTASIALLGVLARYLRRRKCPSNVTYRKLPRNPQLLPNPNGEASGRRSGSPGIRSLHRQGSILSGFSDKMSNASVSLSGGPASEVTAGAQPVTPQQFGVMGLGEFDVLATYPNLHLATFKYT